MKKEMNNKGFSLVELIIVIAIMAILIVVLAPQYLKYVEKSRNSTDVSNATEIVTALQVYASDPDATVPIPASGSSDITITISSGTPSISDVGGFATAALQAAGLADDSGNLSTRCVSRSNWTSYTITAKASNGGLVFSYSASNASGAVSTFADMMAGKSGS
jgi:type IV pilus assembly protein PilA